MKGTRQITFCRVCQSFWDSTAEPSCTDPAHPKANHVMHVHEDSVTLPGGAVIVAASHDEGYQRDIRPDFGLYLDDRWDPPWPHELVDWPDFGLPADEVRFREQLESLLSRARMGERVELGCLGGHGRTGTALACLVVLSGHPASDATAWVRSSYCERAVETPDQEAFVKAFSALPR